MTSPSTLPDPAQEQVAQLTRALDRSRKELDQFVYVASHDLRAPLRGILNLTQWLGEDLGPALTGDSRRQLELLRQRALRMEKLLDALLQFSRAGRHTGSVEPVDVGALLGQLAGKLALAPPAVLRFEPGLATVRCRRAEVEQVFEHLLSNALRHSGRPDVEIRVRAVDEGAAWHFVVEDDGVGIDPEFHERIWGVFQTLEARDKVEGTGMGLPIVRKIVEARGGTAWVESAPSQGARFHFTWPKVEAP